MGMLAATTGIADAKDLPKMKAKAATTLEALAPVKKHRKKAPAKRTPAMKRLEFSSPEISP